MTERPYTDDDLRTEAAKQLATLTDDAEFMCIGERMEGSHIDSADDSTWDQLEDDDFDTAQRAIDALITSAADLSDWAIGIGADGLTASDQRLNVGDSRVRVHFAFAPDMPEVDRRDFIAMLAEAVITGA